MNKYCRYALLIAIFLRALCISLLCARAWQLLVSNSTTQPLPRMGHSAVVYNSSIVIFFGGRTAISSSINNSVEFEDSLCLGGCNEGALAGVCACTNANASITNCTCICNSGFSGTNCEITQVDTWLSETLVLDISTTSWYIFDSDPFGVINPVAWPLVRYMHSAAIVNNLMIVYAGYSQLCGDFCSDLWWYDNALRDAKGRGTWFQVNVSNSFDNPGKRWQHAAAASGSLMFVFGGNRQGEYLNDMWQLNTTLVNDWFWTQIMPASSTNVLPPPRLGHAMAIDVDSGIIYVYGGWDATNLTLQQNHFLSDFWCFELATGMWSSVQINNNGTDMPGPLLGSRAATDSFMFFMYMGYYNNQYDSRIWQYNSSSMYWTQHLIPASTAELPLPRDYHTIVFIPSRSSFYMFGGWGSASSGTNTIPETYYNDLWQLNMSVCPNSCNGRGYCYFGYCFCDAQFYGVDCQHLVCASTRCYYSNITLVQVCEQCNNHGACIQGSCECSEGFTSLNETDACLLTPFCPRQCGGNGVCALSQEYGYSCVCNTGYSGYDCEAASL